ncbi:MAG: hypothetical protein H7338_04135 [Candidatus Sericytochromatia bacterium]|nr:hypothetical protein [Candidatus Sericytochromatia bacterium]
MINKLLLLACLALVGCGAGGPVSPARRAGATIEQAKAALKKVASDKMDANKDGTISQAELDMAKSAKLATPAPAATPEAPPTP